jgi:exopolyphosphatase/guanosine-5'-triphosphate,3'-diphosphate pyrophosphatase
VAAHALSLYDQTRGLLHHDAGEGRRLLWAAAQLHARGKHINIGAYHKHSWYLIRHGELLGYSEHEHLMVAAIARYHRRSLPKKRHEAWQLIEGREGRRTVAEMALLLRLAVALERRPLPVIAGLRATPVGPVAAPTGVTIRLDPRTPEGATAGGVDLSLECWSLRSCAATVAEACGLALEVEGPGGGPTVGP